MPSARASTPPTEPDDGLVDVTIAQYWDRDGELITPGQTARVTPDLAASLRAAGYATPEPPPLRGVRDPVPDQDTNA